MFKWTDTEKIYRDTLHKLSPSETTAQNLHIPCMFQLSAYIHYSLQLWTSNSFFAKSLNKQLEDRGALEA